MERNRIIYADILRIFATFAVIFLHVTARNWYSTPVNSIQWHVFNFYDSIVRWCVPVFFMLSGMFFLNPEKNITSRNIFFKYIARIFAALVFWGIIYSLYSYTKGRHFAGNIISFDVVKYVITKILIGYPWHHLWFLYTIIGIYFLIPLLRFLFKKITKQELKIILISFAVLAPFIQFTVSLIPERGELLLFTIRIIGIIGYLGYFIAGYFFSKYDISRLWKQLIFVFAGISIILTIFGTYILSVNSGKPNEYFYDYFSINTMFFAYAVFIIMKEKLNKLELNIKTVRLIEFISSCTFGIYLVHELFNEFFSKLNIDSLSFNPILSVPLLTVVNFLLSLSVVVFIKKVPWFNKRIV